MPIRFRCTYCNRLLGIATRKAGTQTTCPHCGYAITVPMPQDEANDSRTERINLDDVEEMLGRGATEVAVEPAAAPAVAAAPPAPPVSPPPPVEKRPEPPKVAPPVPAADQMPAAKPRPAPPPIPKANKPIDPNNPPLFEGDVDEILGTTAAPEESERARKPATSGMDAMSLDDGPRHIVISAQKATLLMVVVVVLLAVAFAAGYFIAPK